jgi:cytochrome c5
MKKAVWMYAVAAMLIGAGPVAAADGKAVYEQVCSGCHSAMMPKAGDKAAWAPLIKRGAAALTASVIKGKGAMPPKGGAGSEGEVRAAVDYLIGRGK